MCWTRIFVFPLFFLGGLLVMPNSNRWAKIGSLEMKIAPTIQPACLLPTSSFLQQHFFYKQRTNFNNMPSRSCCWWWWWWCCLFCITITWKAFSYTDSFWILCKFLFIVAVECRFGSLLAKEYFNSPHSFPFTADYLYGECLRMNADGSKQEEAILKMKQVRVRNACW